MSSEAPIIRTTFFTTITSLQSQDKFVGCLVLSREVTQQGKFVVNWPLEIGSMKLGPDKHCSLKVLWSPIGNKKIFLTCCLTSLSSSSCWPSLFANSWLTCCSDFRPDNISILSLVWYGKEGGNRKTIMLRETWILQLYKIDNKRTQADPTKMTLYKSSFMNLA